MSPENSSCVLLIEDDPHILRLMETVLKSEKYESVKAATAAEAVAHLRKTDCQLKLIVTDYNLPDANGGDVADLARRQPWTKNIPILLISAEQSNQTFTKMVSDGRIDAYLSKPFPITNFLKTAVLLLNMTKANRK